MSNFNGNSISIIDIATDTVTGIVNINSFSLDHPHSVNFITSSRAYVNSYGTNQVLVINAATDTIIGAVDDTLGPFSGPGFSRRSPDPSIVLECNNGNSTVDLIDTATNAVTANISEFISSPAKLCYSPDGLTAYVSNLGNNTVSIIDIGTNTGTGVIDDSNYPFSIPYALEAADF